MQKSYWEKVAPNYDDEIFDVFANDTSGTIRAQLEKLGSSRKTACDIGCAVGKWLPSLSEHYKQVYAVDISETNIAIAQDIHAELGNIEFIQADLTTKAAEKIPACNLVLCVNAILTSSYVKRINFFNAVANCTLEGGHILLVVPSLESKMYAEFMFQQWNYKDGKLPGVEQGRQVPKRYANLKQGVVEIDNVPTKHYLQEELVISMKEAGCVVEQIEKVEYTWDTEFENPPAWMEAPYPWDWMVVARKC